MMENYSIKEFDAYIAPRSTLIDRAIERDSVFLAELNWDLGRSLLLWWLRLRHQIEPWFIASPMRSIEALSHQILLVLDAPGVNAHLGVWFDEMRDLCNLVVEKRVARQEELVPKGLAALDASASVLFPRAAFYARYQHMKGFVLRISGQTNRYLQHMVQFRDSTLRHPNGSLDWLNYYARLRYEEGCWALFGMGAEEDVSKDRVNAANLSFIEAKRAALNGIALSPPTEHSLNHILFGSLRNRVLISLKIQDYLGAQQEFVELCKSFPMARKRLFPYDRPLLTALAEHEAEHEAVASMRCALESRQESGYFFFPEPVQQNTMWFEDSISTCPPISQSARDEARLSVGACGI